MNVKYLHGRKRTRIDQEGVSQKNLRLIRLSSIYVVRCWGELGCKTLDSEHYARSSFHCFVCPKTVFKKIIFLILAFEQIQSNKTEIYKKCYLSYDRSNDVFWSENCP